MHNKTYIIYDGKVYKSLYKLIYAIGFPSKAEYIKKSNAKNIYKEYGELEFEVSEKHVYTELIRCIIALCEDSKFETALRHTGIKYINNQDDNDTYFGFPNNVYGECLMLVRDYKLYL